jgi:cysteine desulfurase
VLRALGMPDELANGSFRICIGRFTSDAEIDFAIEHLVAAIRRLRGKGAQA